MASNTYSFTNSLKKGKEGEAVAAALLLALEANITDASDDPYFRKLDVDFLENNTAMRIECKYSSTTKNEVWIETISRMDKDGTIKSPGWGFLSAADYITIYQPNNNRIIVLKGYELRKFMFLHSPEYEEKTQHNNGKYGEYWSAAIPFPYEVLIKNNIVLANYKVLDNNNKLLLEEIA